MRNPVKFSFALIVGCAMLGFLWIEVPGLILSSWCHRCHDFQSWQGKDSNELVEKFGRPTHVFPSSEAILNGTSLHAVGPNLVQKSYYKPEKMNFRIGVANGKILVADLLDHRHLLNSLYYGEYFDSMASLPVKKER